jgi:hypothetical protein
MRKERAEKAKAAHIKIKTPPKRDFANIVTSSREFIAALLKDDWFESGQTGSHRHFKHPTKPGKVRFRIQNATCP